jgi:hypothetical protein
MTDELRRVSAGRMSHYWQNWDIARRVVIFPDGTGGYTMDAYGGTHPFGGAPNNVTQPYWPGRDIAKSIWGA